MNNKIIIVAALVAFLVMKPASNFTPYTGENSDKRGMRNRNPFNIRISAANNWLGKVPLKKNTDGAFEQFYQFSDGVRAGLILLTNYYKSGLQTLPAIINKWAPASDNNDVQAYVDAVSQWAALPASGKLIWNRETVTNLARAMIRVETGHILSQSIIDGAYDQNKKLLSVQIA